MRTFSSRPVSVVNCITWIPNLLVEVSLNVKQDLINQSTTTTTVVQVIYIIYIKPYEIYQKENLYKPLCNLLLSSKYLDLCL